MPKRALEQRITALQATTGVEPLRNALSERNNYVVSRAAAIAAARHAEELVPDLIAAFDRFFIDPTKSDPQCLAKSAIATALRELGHHEPSEFVRGIVHTQLEPSWGGQADTAAALRGACALALVDCPLDPTEILTYLADGLADGDKVVRIDCAMAISNLGRPEGAIPLRLKALMGDAEADVLGHCFAALLSLGATGTVAFVGRFLDSEDADVQFEAASALAQCREPEAVELLVALWQNPLLSLELRRALLLSLGASPVRAAAEFLLKIAEDESAELAATALEAVAISRYGNEFEDRIKARPKRDSSASGS